MHRILHTVHFATQYILHKGKTFFFQHCPLRACTLDSKFDPALGMGGGS